MSANLEFYAVDLDTAARTKLEGSFSFGNIFKGAQKKAAITIFNNGDTTAVAPKCSIKEYPDESGLPVQWKKLSFNKNTGYNLSLSLPDIEPKSWLKGQTVQFEDFNNYPVVAGTKPDMSWLLTEGTAYGWEVYNGWLQHNPDTINGKALWTELSSAADFTFEIEISSINGTWSGLLVRDEGDSDTGYIILIQCQDQYLGNIPSDEGVIQVWSGSYSQGIDSWDLLYQSNSVGKVKTRAPFKLVVENNVFKFWYNDTAAESPLYTFVDVEYTHVNASRPIVLCHASAGSARITFDNIKMSVDNDEGVIYIQNDVPKDTPLFSQQLTLLDIEYGDVQ